MKGEADVALRSGDTDDGELVGRKIGDSIWAVYASHAYIERHGRPAAAGGPGAARAGRVSTTRWPGIASSPGCTRSHRTPRVVARSNSVLGLVYSAKAGVGVAPLPIALGDAEPDLVQVIGPVAELTRIWRVLTTPELRRTPRVAAFFDFVVSEIDTLRPIITG